jgi:hypothetical protein
MPSAVVTQPCPHPASAGIAVSVSRDQLQEYIERFPRFLNEEIERQLPARTRLPGQHTQWLSPMESDRYRLAPSADFLRAAGLSDQTSWFDRNWSRLGACWDAVGLLPRGGTLPQGVLLIEAKGRLEEIDDPSSRLTARSGALIQETFHETRQWLNALETEDWTGSLYRTANRLAHLHLLRNHLDVPAWLVQVYFLNDPAGPASRTDWLPVIAGVHARLGLCRRPPFTLDVFLPALHPA